MPPIGPAHVLESAGQDGVTCAVQLIGRDVARIGHKSRVLGVGHFGSVQPESIEAHFVNRRFVGVAVLIVRAHHERPGGREYLGARRAAGQGDDPPVDRRGRRRRRFGRRCGWLGRLGRGHGRGFQRQFCRRHSGQGGRRGRRYLDCGRGLNKGRRRPFVRRAIVPVA